MVAKTRTTLIAMPNANWRWEAALLHIWNAIQEEESWSSIHQPTLRCNDITVPMKDKDAFIQHYMAKLLAHDERKGCLMLTLNFRDIWGTIHRTKRWAFVGKTDVLEER